MAGLDVTFKPVDGDPVTGIVEMSGVIDGTTLSKFQDSLDDLVKRGVRNLVVDMSRVRYVNSTGLGAIVKFNDRLKGTGGGLALAKVTPKVKIVIEMLGLQAFFEICADERQALEALARGHGGAPGAPSAAPVAPAFAPPPPSPAFAPSPTPPPFPAGAPYAPPAYAPPGAPPPPAAQPWGAPPPAARPAPPPAVAPKPGAFPMTVACASCSVEVEVREPGNWKCPRCYTLVTVRPDGTAKFMAQDRQSPYEISLNCTREGAEALSNFVGSLAHHCIGNGGAVEQVRAAVGEVVHVIASSAYAYDPNAIVHVSVETMPSEIRIKLADYGKTLDSTRTDAYFPNATRTMNEFECRAHPKGGNIIRMVKRK